MTSPRKARPTVSALKIPKGWRKLRKGTQLCKGDRLFEPGVDLEYTPITFTIKGYIAGLSGCIYIRRAQPRRHAGKGKKEIYDYDMTTSRDPSSDPTTRNPSTP